MHQLDLDGDGVLTGTGELDEVNPLGGMSPHFNKANELIARDRDGDGTDDDTQTFDAVGNLTDDGRDYKYIYDAFGRLVEVTDQSDNTVAAYSYNGLNHRISWHYDVTGSGGGPVPDGSVNGDDPTFYFVYNERWQHVATYRGADANPKEQFLYHAAGVAGSGSSSYVDAMLLRDDHDAATPEEHADAAADSTLERRVYYVQNWRADIVALLADNGRVLERAWHEPYGTPWGLPAADFTTSNTSGNDDYGVPDGDADASDQGYFNTLHAASSTRADLTGSAVSSDFAYGRPDGTVDLDDSNYYLDILAAADTLGRGALSAEDGLRNRRGLSGYEWDPTHDKYHVRHRVLRPETGRWTRRDPAGYVDGANLYLYGRSAPVGRIDPTGTRCSPFGCIFLRMHACCTAACHAGVAGAIVCCYGMALTCVCNDNIDDNWSNDTFKAQFRKCVQGHEDVHAGDVNCDECDDNYCSFDDLPWKDPDCGAECSECDAYSSELDCIRSIDCKGDSECEEEKQRAFEYVLDQALDWCDRCDTCREG